jgi:hypothetical protein
VPVKENPVSRCAILGSGNPIIDLADSLELQAIFEAFAPLRESEVGLSKHSFSQRRKDDDSLHARQASHILPAIPIIFDLIKSSRL